MFVAKQIENKNKDELLYRVSFTNEAEAKEWLQLYQLETRTHWQVDKTFPEPQQ